MLKWTIIGGAVVLALIIIAGVVVYMLVPGIRPPEPESTAKYFPEDVLTYGWMTLSPGFGQGRHMVDTWERFDEIQEFRDAVNEFLDDLEKDTGIDFKDEVLPWLGPDMSFAVLDTKDFESVDAVAILSVQDHDGATDFLDDWLDYLEDEEGAQFEEDSSGDFDIWSYEEEMQVYALSEDRLVLATTEDALDEVLDLISGKDRKTLAETTGFKEARGAMQDGRVLSLYVNTEDLMNVVSDVSAIDVMPRTGKDGILRVPEWGAASARFLDRGLVMEIVVPNNSEFAAAINKIDTPAKVLPEDTLGFFAASFDPDMDNWRAELEDYTFKDLGFPSDFERVLDEMELDTSSRDPRRELSLDSTFDEILDIGIDIVEELTNINLEQDFFDYLRGQAIISVRDIDFERAEDIENYTVDVAAMLSYDPHNKEELMDTMDDVTGFIESSGFVTSDGEDVGAEEDATIFDLEEQMGDTAYSPGYVLHDGYLIIGSTQNA